MSVFASYSFTVGEHENNMIDTKLTIKGNSDRAVLGSMETGIRAYSS